MTVLDELRSDAETALARITSIVHDHLPALHDQAQADLEQAAAAKAAADAEAGDPLVTAARAAVHLSPEFRAALATTITKADTDIAALEPEPAPEPADESHDDSQADLQPQTGVAQ
jgi:hypothetical protein